MCLPEDASLDYAGKDAVVTGWGTTESGGTVSNVLREVTVGVIKNRVRTKLIA